MTDDRIRELMKQTPCPDSVSVYLAMRQIANEVEQEVLSKMGFHWWDKMPQHQDYRCDCLDGANVNQSMLDEIHGYKPPPPGPVMITDPFLFDYRGSSS